MKKKDEDFTALNVDDYIRDKKKEGAKYIGWGKNGWKRFSDFFEAATGCGIGFSDINIKIMSYCIKNHNHKPKNGELFLGIVHRRQYIKSSKELKATK